MATIILQGANLNETKARATAHSLNGELELRPGFYKVHCPQAPSRDAIISRRPELDFDINLLPDTFAVKDAGLLVTDMDSTLIAIECIDEIADFLNIKPQVSEITEAAMAGEIDFITSLRQRVSLLSGLDAGALDHVYNERLRLSNGAEAMLHGLRSNGIKVGLVSGGFTYFTDRLQKKLALDYTLANTLEIIENKLSGKVLGNIVGAEAKATFLLERCKALGIEVAQAVAIGDGANDLLMMKEAGLSIAFHAKPAVQAQAHTAINHCGLEGVLGLLDIATE